MLTNNYEGKVPGIKSTQYHFFLYKPQTGKPYSAKQFLNDKTDLNINRIFIVVPTML